MSRRHRTVRTTLSLVDKGAVVAVKFTVTEWERVLHALASHDARLRDRLVEVLQAAADEQHRKTMVPPWE